MPDYCCVPICTNQGRPFSFHQFPENKKLRKAWLHAVKRKNLTEKNLSRNIKVCSQHFKPEDFVTTLLGERRKLKQGAIPSQFTWIQGKLPKSRARKSFCRKEVNDSEEPIPSEPEEATVPDFANEEVVGDIEQIRNTPVPSYISDNSTQTTLAGNLDIRNIMKNPEAVQHYTGFLDSEHFNLVFAALGENRNNLQVFPLDPIVCFFLTIMKLRTNKPDIEIALNFGIHKETVGRIFNVWINFMYHQFKELNVWPDRETVLQHSPQAFKNKYPTTRVIIDAIEVLVMKPKSPKAQQATFSTYKNANTVKVLIGINPSGLICFISDAYGGAVSDQQLFIRSGMLDLLEAGDSVMAERGFNIQDLLCSKGITVNIPPFLKGKKQLTPLENIATRRIASNRIHIERAIGLAKTYKMLQSKLHISKIRLSGFNICMLYVMQFQKINHAKLNRCCVM